MKKILHLLLLARMQVFKVYGYIVLLFSCLLMNTVGVLGASLKVRLFVCWIWSCLYRLGTLVILQIYVKVEGKENIPDYPCIYVSKHQSMLETFVFYGLVHDCCFVMKQELLEKPIFGKTNIFAEAIGVDRSKGLSAIKKVLEDGKDRIENKNLSIIIFPEGTRVPVGEYPKFHRSAMKLAKVSNVPIIPVAHNFGVYFGRKKGDFVKPGIARMSFGKPIDPKDYSVAELTDLCYDIINDKTKSYGG
ncbi:1-acyl-sn-glycerol-3-phosphate acyltransferase [Francisella noatunensis]|uniref:1-acyl-sn-glycerol-3-phosphate acyltransferase n=2 Tax=Francisella TaxID=262 RepID=A0A9Q2KX02_9GAMM|nr:MULTISPECIES: lysophospholipid acyltransferase family protein [Francisella]AJI74798.1 acyltransferase family protein [Francisella philomiragia subsp. philomiragia ATCC 25015]EET20625.1 acyltransferase [Francisella philomiragia subsp. philomiragia ATCC 25015]MBK2029097.1 1-acyl-sn-glycerol-3-phosphate acyltransferase [Francisella noatunensis]MBK2033546.1 1-acyl-sn-glycerol-3-phosphate acyltransferase [Francisella noatunensis]MBK2048722.1 1-acyl-sn-glycerol-3-phosphate acyltransferase [Franci